MRGYDYANEGAYYLTICTYDRRHWLGRIVDGVMHRSPTGELAQRCWDAIPEHMPHVDVGDFVVMPDHVHGIVVIRERLVGVRGDATDGVVGGVSDGVMGVGARRAPTECATHGSTRQTTGYTDRGVGSNCGIVQIRRYAHRVPRWIVTTWHAHMAT